MKISLYAALGNFADQILTFNRNTFFCGTVFTVCIIQIPLRLQAVNHLSALESGIRLLPYGLFVPFGSFAAAVLTGKRNIPPVFLLLFGATAQTIAIILLSTLPTHVEFRKGSLGLQVLAGIGTGLCLGSLVMLTPHVCEKRDLGIFRIPKLLSLDIMLTRYKAVATAAINQFRFLGGSVGLAIVSSIMYSWTRERFMSILDPIQVDKLEQTTVIVSQLAPKLQEKVGVIFAEGYNLQMKILAGLSAMQFIATAIMWQRKPVRIGSTQI